MYQRVNRAGGDFTLKSSWLVLKCSLLTLEISSYFLSAKRWTSNKYEIWVVGCRNLRENCSLYTGFEGCGGSVVWDSRCLTTELHSFACSLFITWVLTHRTFISEILVFINTLLDNSCLIILKLLDQNLTPCKNVTCVGGLPGTSTPAWREWISAQPCIPCKGRRRKRREWGALWKRPGKFIVWEVESDQFLQARR